MTEREVDEGIVAEFAKRKTRQFIAIVPAVAAVIVLVIAKQGGGLFGLEATVIGTIAAVVVGGVLVFSFINWRCPACRAYLGRGTSPKFCRKCGVRLQRE